jgi:hypothetical protein
MERYGVAMVIGSSDVELPSQDQEPWKWELQG